MITRLDNPGKPSSLKDVSYNNKGSVARLKNYLIKNEEKYNTADLFFTATKSNMPADEFYKMIDTNVKGLSRDEHKFYSFTINPSSDELKFINSDKEKLKEFVRAAMTNFKTAHKTLTESDGLVWGAIIHENRLYTAEDLKKSKEGRGEAPKFKVGDIKRGENSHIHVVLSARDTLQQKTITVLTTKNRLSRNFELMNFQRNNQKLFQNLFFYQNGVNIYAQGQINIAAQRIEKLNRKFFNTYRLDDITSSGNKMEWSTQFNRNFTYLIREAHQGKQILFPDVYLEKGKKYYEENIPDGKKEISKIDTTYIPRQTISYDNAFYEFSAMLESEGRKQERKGYDIIKKPNRKRRPGLRRGI